jgi:hypothetical protein
LSTGPFVLRFRWPIISLLTSANRDTRVALEWHVNTLLVCGFEIG